MSHVQSVCVCVCVCVCVRGPHKGKFGHRHMGDKVM